jgi:hypothetical protein
MILRGSSLTPLSVGFQWELASTPFYLVVVLIVVMDDLRRCSNFLGESMDKLLILPSHLLEIGRILSSHFLDASH